MVNYNRRYDTARPDVRVLLLGALGIVYGDIGTSPLYTIRETFAGSHPLPMDELHIFGILSLIFWSLILMVTLKYVILILRADNNGEGGVLALGAMAAKKFKESSRWRAPILFLSIVGLALFFGDSLITPAISVLSAVEGLKAVSPDFQPFIVPIALVVLVALFAFQSRGSLSVGTWFGPVMLLWFTVLAVMGVIQIAHEPKVLQALNPYYALHMAIVDPWKVFISLGVVVLAITGAEALYADMGHFGRKPIQRAWFMLVLPALTLNYFGQCALLLREPELVDYVFFRMAPDWALYPLIALATCATIIASQAVISGIFSMSQQAVLLGLLPRMETRHTSPTEQGQIYIPRINWVVMVGVILLVVGFGSSSNLAAAYGIAVTGTVMVDSVLAAIVAVMIWRWHWGLALAVFGSLLVIDVLFFAANVLKVLQGGWFPLVMAAVVFVLVATWRNGRRVLYDKLYREAIPIKAFLFDVKKFTRIDGTAVFMTADIERMPKALYYNLRHNQVLHERVLLVNVKIENVPWWPRQQRIEVKELGQGFYAVTVHYGFMDRPDVPKALRRCSNFGLEVDPLKASFFLSRETLIASKLPDMGPIEERIYMALSATAMSATSFFRIPPDLVLELGTHVEI